MKYQYLMKQYILFKDKELVNTNKLDFAPNTLEKIAQYFKPDDTEYNTFLQELEKADTICLLSTKLSGNTLKRLEPMIEYFAVGGEEMPLDVLQEKSFKIDNFSYFIRGTGSDLENKMAYYTIWRNHLLKNETDENSG